MDANYLEDLEVKNIIEGSICSVEYDNNICVGQLNTNFLSTRADTNTFGFTTYEYFDNKDQKGQESDNFFEEYLVGDNDQIAQEEIPNDNNFNEQKTLDIVFSKNTKKNYNHTYQNLGTQYYNFIKKAISQQDMQGIGILKFEYELILEEAKKLGQFKSKTELINIHTPISQETKIQDNLNYVDLITEKLQKTEPDLKERIKKYNSFVKINKKLLSQFKEETLKYLKNFEKEVLETENQKSQKKLQIYEQIKTGIDKLEEKIKYA
ncbi:hypothetical protein TTHERM_00188890 (macronuclear) [Tetrahymena thermophila SB210]|uniref:Uncharacterized protein n=1 Tax=Tetrahymena thermophila (strain SB210) TaxID=312017 RepID=I7MJG5_TETTS|nr:hypothetical protein TTHERM_00188890 [Tetrahymena thermophila SB210]EAR96320.1 hypothetical protein TTHERM_00188890 [Tetrahymena thermophila SB210]|eukprot:XP_001016565.1 hypothetical protein TTHERM_00188890 [Tetrahymena thermophila SB210]